MKSGGVYKEYHFMLYVANGESEEQICGFTRPTLAVGGVGFLSFHKGIYGIWLGLKGVTVS